MKMITIDRSKWRFGGNTEKIVQIAGETRLLNSSNYMCCLGFVCEQSGIPKDKILHVSLPQDIFNEEYRKLIPELVSIGVVRTELTSAAVDLNDRSTFAISRSEREDKLTTLFMYHGIKLEFTGEYDVALGV